MPLLRQNNCLINSRSEFLSLTNTSFQNEPNDAVPSDRLWLRSELMGTQVITRDTGRRLGVVGEVVVDIDRREVIALGLRDNPFVLAPNLWSKTMISSYIQNSPGRQGGSYTMFEEKGGCSS